MTATAELKVDDAAEWEAAQRGRESTPGEQVLDNILDLAIVNDSMCQHYANRLRKEGETDADGVDLVTAYRQAITNLCSIIAPAAIKRVPAFDIFSKAFVDTGAVWELEDDGLGAFLRPIFEESGIGPRYEP